MPNMKRFRAAIVELWRPRLRRSILLSSHRRIRSSYLLGRGPALYLHSIFSSGIRASHFLIDFNSFVSLPLSFRLSPSHSAGSRDCVIKDQPRQHNIRILLPQLLLRFRRVVMVTTQQLISTSFPLISLDV